MKPFAIAIHGGAGTILKGKMTKKKAQAYRTTLKSAYTKGYAVLEKGGSSLNAVKEAILVLEDSPLFNAGTGSVFTHDGTIEMDAALMEGKKLMAGAIAAVPFIKNPILLAHAVLKQGDHVLISGEKALEFAKMKKLEIKPQSYFETDDRRQQWLRALEKDVLSLDHDEGEGQKFGTVGAVALDKKGNLAAGTSTGGMVNKKYGRIGDSPLIGTGTYANNETCAISCTGYGEYFIRKVVAHEISSMMKYANVSLEEAARKILLQEIPKMGGRGGLIGIDRSGAIVLPFTTRGMYRGFKHSNGNEFVGIFDSE